MTEVELYETEKQWRTVARIRDTADRIEREAKRQTAHSRLTYRTCDVVHELHTTLANLPLDSLIAAAHDAEVSRG